MNLLIFMTGMILGIVVGLIVEWIVILWGRRVIEEDDKFYQRLERERLNS